MRLRRLGAQPVRCARRAARRRARREGAAESRADASSAAPSGGTAALSSAGTAGTCGCVCVWPNWKPRRRAVAKAFLSAAAA
eukprot:3245276-Prymnesium_polylepis.1